MRVPKVSAAGSQRELLAVILKEMVPVLGGTPCPGVHTSGPLHRHASLSVRDSSPPWLQSPGAHLSLPHCNS